MAAAEAARGACAIIGNNNRMVSLSTALELRDSGIGMLPILVTHWHVHRDGAYLGIWDGSERSEHAIGGETFLPAPTTDELFTLCPYGTHLQTGLAFGKYVAYVKVDMTPTIENDDWRSTPADALAALLIRNRAFLDMYQRDEWFELARRAFDAYNEAAGGKTWDGKDIPPFEEVGVKVQANWVAVAKKLCAKNGSAGVGSAA